MADRIEIVGLSAFGCHGVLDFEKTIPQPFLLDISLEVDLLPAGRTDDLAASLSYAEVARRALDVCAGEPVNLIETLAERVASACLEWPQVEAAEVTVHKPNAPAGVAFVPVGGRCGPSVFIRRERRRECVIALGTNLGRRVATLNSALAALRRVDGLEVVHVSPLVETEPVGGVPQPQFLNAVIIGETRLAGEHLMRELHRIEASHGRRRDVRWGARTLDLDLIQLGTPGADDEVRVGGPGAAVAEASSSPLALPHPRAAERAFVLAPWASAAPWASMRCGAEVRSVGDVLRDVGLQGVSLGPGWHESEQFDAETVMAAGEMEGTE